MSENISKSQLYAGDLMMLTATLVWGGMTVFSKQILSELDIFNMIALRFLLSFGLCLAVFWKRYRSLRRQTVLHSLVLGALLFVSYFFMVWGCDNTTASNSGFMMSLTAVFIPLILALRFRRLPSRRLMLSVLITICGVGLMCLSPGFSLNFGDWLCVICAFCYSFQMIFSERYAHQDDPVVLGTLQLLFVGLLALVCSLVMEDGLRLPATGAGWWQLGYLAVFCGALGFIMQTLAVQRIPSSHASLIFATEPVFVALFAFFLLQESIGPRQIIGMAVVFVGVFITEYKKAAIVQDSMVKEA